MRLLFLSFFVVTLFCSCESGQIKVKGESNEAVDSGGPTTPISSPFNSNDSVYLNLFLNGKYDSLVQYYTTPERESDLGSALYYLSKYELTGQADVMTILNDFKIGDLYQPEKAHRYNFDKLEKTLGRHMLGVLCIYDGLGCSIKDWSNSNLFQMFSMSMTISNDSSVIHFVENTRRLGVAYNGFFIRRMDSLIQRYPKWSYLSEVANKREEETNGIPVTCVEESNQYKEYDGLRKVFNSRRSPDYESWKIKVGYDSLTGFVLEHQWISTEEAKRIMEGG